MINRHIFFYLFQGPEMISTLGWRISFSGFRARFMDSFPPQTRQSLTQENGMDPDLVLFQREERPKNLPLRSSERDSWDSSPPHSGQALTLWERNGSRLSSFSESRSHWSLRLAATGIEEYWGPFLSFFFFLDKKEARQDDPVGQAKNQGCEDFT